MGLALRAARLDRGLSVRGLARLSHVNHSTIIQIEAGRARARAGTVAKLSRALDQDDDVVDLARGCEGRPRAIRGSRRHLYDIVPWWRDRVSRYVAAAHPEGVTAAQVADVLHLSHDVVERAEASALQKLRDASAHDPEVRRWAATVLQVRLARERSESSRDWCAAGGGEDD